MLPLITPATAPKVLLILLEPFPDTACVPY